MVEGQALIVQNGFPVGQHLPGLRLNIPGYQAARDGVQGDLPGAEQEVTHADGVIVGTGGRCNVGGFDDGFCSHDWGTAPSFSSAFASTGQGAGRNLSIEEWPE